ncbi:MAG TPA: CBS and ACT domain-containing protein [Longimicrobiales bacterium]|nr:CBS and ACT domain-containing protein [Longimicrobiales bacterium]
MTSHVHTVAPDTSLADALAITRQHRIRHLPVMSHGKLAGLLSDRDLRLAIPPAWAVDHTQLLAALHQRTVGEIMVTELITVTPDTAIEDAAKLLYTHRIGCLPVLDGGTLVGILTETDLLRAFTELFGAGSTSTRLEVEMPNKPGELARVVRLIGIENRVNITGMVVPPLRGGAAALAIIHLQTADPSSIIYALRKVGYRVGSPSIENDPAADVPVTDDEAPRNRSATRALAEL